MENKEVPSANNLHALLSPFGKVLTYVSKTKDTQEWNIVVLQLAYQLRTNTGNLKLCFWSLLVKKSFSMLIKSPHGYIVA